MNATAMQKAYPEITLAELAKGITAHGSIESYHQSELIPRYGARAMDGANSSPAMALELWTGRTHPPLWRSSYGRDDHTPRYGARAMDGTTTPPMPKPKLPTPDDQEPTQDPYPFEDDEEQNNMPEDQDESPSDNPTAEDMPQPEADDVTLKVNGVSISATRDQMTQAIEAAGIKTEKPKAPKVPASSINSLQWRILRASIAGNEHAWLYGEAGTGKTTAALNVAAEHGRKAIPVAVGPMTDEYTIKGSRDAEGNYHPSEFRLCWEHGHVLVLDEIDTANPSLLTCINGAIEQRLCTFPDAPEGIPAHPDFLVIATANTDGQEMKAGYAREVQDTATRDRFQRIEWVLESHIIDAVGAPKVILAAWIKARKAIADHGVNKTLTVRGLRRATKLAANGLNELEAINAAIFDGWKEDQRQWAK